MLWLLRWVLQIRPVHNIAMRQLHSSRVRVCSYSPRSLPRLLARSLSLPIPLPFPTRTVSVLHLVCFFSLHLSPLSVSPLPSAPALNGVRGLGAARISQSPTAQLKLDLLSVSVISPLISALFRSLRKQSAWDIGAISSRPILPSDLLLLEFAHAYGWVGERHG